MGEHEFFHYTQARLQARHGQRPDAQTWNHLEITTDIANFLQHARRTSLRPWVINLHFDDSIHNIEITLKYTLREYVDRISTWVPQSWRKSVAWVSTLMDLPILQHLLAGNTPPVWLHYDNLFTRFSNLTPIELQNALQVSTFQPLVTTWQAGTPLVDAWIVHWMRLWPETSATHRANLQQLITLFTEHLGQINDNSAIKDTLSRDGLESALNWHFRKYSRQPSTVFSHLGLIALDTERLRGDIVTRKIFEPIHERAQ